MAEIRRRGYSRIAQAANASIAGGVKGAGRIISARDAANLKPSSVEVQAETTRLEEQNPELKNNLEMAFGGQDDLLMPYQPTPSINPPRPRTLAAGYDRQSGSLFVRFREGAMYRYEDVTPREWAAFRQVNSPGRYINRVLNNKNYSRLQG